MARKTTRPTVPAIPRPGEAKRGPQGHLGYLLRQAHASFRGAMDRALGELGLTTPQFTVLTMIVAYPGLSGADLARLAFLTPQTINVIVSNLERDGAIEKTAHATHGRILRLHATARGQALLRRCRAQVETIEADLSAALGRDGDRALRRWLSAVAEQLNEIR